MLMALARQVLVASVVMSALTVVLTEQCLGGGRGADTTTDATRTWRARAMSILRVCARLWDWTKRGEAGETLTLRVTYYGHVDVIFCPSVLVVRGNARR